MYQHAQSDRTTPLQSMQSMALSAMILSLSVIYLCIYELWTGLCETNEWYICRHVVRYHITVQVSDCSLRRIGNTEQKQCRRTSLPTHTVPSLKLQTQHRVQQERNVFSHHVAYIAFLHPLPLNTCSYTMHCLFLR